MQFLNALKLVESGIGLSLRLENLSYENILETATELLTNTKYRARAKMLSKNFKNVPEDSLTKTLNCLEFYLKYNRSCVVPNPKNDVPWYEVIYLDLILAFVMAIALVALTILYISKKIYKFFTDYILKEFSEIQKKLP